jgi:uncharacterized coiled-coil protein SlyX
MTDDFTPRAASRARWIAELSAALDEAQILLSQLVAERIGQVEIDRLRARIEELREELRALNRRGFAPGQVIEPPRLLHPDWRPRRG